MKFVLVLILAGTGPTSSITSVEGFTSNATCKAAGEVWVTKTGYQNRYVCLEVK